MCQLETVLFTMFYITGSLLASCACGQDIQKLRDMAPRIVGDVLPRDLVDGAPNIVIATIKSVQNEGDKLSFNDEKYGIIAIQKQAISLDVESELKGTIQRDQIVMTYYVGHLSASPQMSLEHQVREGQRRIFFLRQTAAGIRSFQDVFASDLYMCSGRHAVVPTNSPDTNAVSFAIATLLLTPTAGIDEREFARCLSASSVSNTIFLAGRTVTIDLLRGLTTHNSPVIRFESSLLLARRFDGQTHYLDNLLKTGTLSDDQRRIADLTLRQYTEYEQHLEFELRRDAYAWVESEAKSYRGGDPQGNFCDELKMLTTHENPRIRKLACGVTDSITMTCAASQNCN